MLTQLLPNLPYKGDGSLPQCIVERDPIAPPFGMRVDGPLRHLGPEHLLEAQRLRAELQVGVRRPSAADLVLDRKGRLARALCYQKTSSWR